MRLAGKIALVTGAGKGIGRTIALVLAREGCELVVNDIDVEPMDHVVEEIKKMGGRSVAIAADVCNQHQVSSMMDECVKTLGRIDILVNNAGGSLGTPAKLGEVMEDHRDLVIDVNLKFARHAGHAGSDQAKS